MLGVLDELFFNCFTLTACAVVFSDFINTKSWAVYREDILNVFPARTRCAHFKTLIATLTLNKWNGPTVEGMLKVIHNPTLLFKMQCIYNQWIWITIDNVRLASLYYNKVANLSISSFTCWKAKIRSTNWAQC